MTSRDRARVLLVWPGGLFGGGANFGVPQLLAIAAAMKRAADVDVTVVDLDIEHAFGRVDFDAIVTRAPYDLVGIACYSSYDYLKVMALGARVRELLPRAWLVTGGYHPSARPDDFTGEESPFDFVAIGDGEGPMARLASALVSGKRPLLRILGPEPVGDPGAMPEVDWHLLDRYRPVARKVASQAEIYLSRGCPYDCAFCMERAKRDTSWRALEPGRAIEEMRRLDRFLDLSSWTIFIADALFGMKTAWRREFLEMLARRPVRARKVWLLVRLDLLEREDLVLMQRANVAPGFGLESGDPDHVRRIRKVGRLSDYLDQMLRVSEWARELGVPWGANIIVGHPGETEKSLRTTAKFLERLYLGDSRGTTGFVSVDPFRLYPGSPIDEERADWEKSTGMRVLRYPWWKDGDQDFLSEWVDPSSELDFGRCHDLRFDLIAPIVRAIPSRFAYEGPARDYFERAIREQIDLLRPEVSARTLAFDRMWRSLVDLPPANEARFAAASRIVRQHVVPGDDAIARAIEVVPREHFVPLDELPNAHRDVPIPLAPGATVSAMHAYAMTFRALELAEGDRLVDLGAGTGYGAALAAHVVGERGSVTAVEIDVDLAARASELLATHANVNVVAADAHDTTAWNGATKVSVGFDVAAIPERWIDALAPGGRLVTPESGKLVVVDKDERGRVSRRAVADVRYVRDRSERREIDAGEPTGVRVLEAGATRAST